MKSALFFLVAVVSAGVQVLTDRTFDAFVKENRHVLVKFHAPWCGHCKELAPEFESAAEQLEGSAIFADVDATVEKQVSAKYDILSYPSLKFFVDGEPLEYAGHRTASGMVEWVTRMTGPAMTIGAPETPSGAKPTVTLYAPSLLPDFEDAARASRFLASFHFVETPDSDSPTIHLVHKNEEPRELLAAETPLTADVITSFVQEHKIPLVGLLDDETFKQYMDAGRGLIWSLFPMEEEDTSDTVRAKYGTLMKEVAVALREKYYLTYTDTIQFRAAVEGIFGVSEFPCFVLHRKAGDKKHYIYHGPMEADTFLEYVADVESGTIQPAFKSEAALEHDDGPVKIVVGSTLKEMAFSETQDVLLMIYAPWCEHCKKLAPEYDRVAHKVAKEKMNHLVMIAKMDGASNDSSVDFIEWSGFPTLFFIKAGSEVVVKYDGGLTAQKIWKYIKKSSSHKDEIKRIMAENKKNVDTDALTKEEL